MDSISRDILQVLRERRGEHLSGGELSAEIKANTVDVQDEIARLLCAGYNIEIHPILGYKLLSAPDVLSDVEIANSLSTNRLGRTIYSYNEIGSTNDVALRLGREGAEDGTLVVAESQAAGRGRLGREWHSPGNLGIWMSLILRPKIKAAKSMRITMLSGISVACAVREISGLSAKLKWPNDVLTNGRKVAGILTETRLDGERLDFAVVGIGLNVNHKTDDFPDYLKGKATSLFIESGRSYKRAELVGRILTEMEREGHDLEYGERILERWRGFSDTLSRRIRISEGDRIIEGVAVAVDVDGALIVEGDKGLQQHFLAGEIEYVE